jgi:hypothetical protein
MNYFKVGTRIALRWDAIKNGDLDSKAKEYLRDRIEECFKVVNLEEEDEKWLHRLEAMDGTSCPTPLYIDEIMEFVKEWDI